MRRWVRGRRRGVRVRWRVSRIGAREGGRVRAPREMTQPQIYTYADTCKYTNTYTSVTHTPDTHTH